MSERNEIGKKASKKDEKECPCCGAKRPGCFGHDFDPDSINCEYNRRQNLRFCTVSENMHNQAAGLRGSSGVRGVSWNNTKKRWVAMIKVGPKRHYLGQHKFKDDAVAARRDAEIRFGVRL